MSRRDLDTNQPFVELFREFRSSSLFEKLVFLSVAASIILAWVKLFNSYN